MLEELINQLSKEMELDSPLKASIPNLYTIPLEESLSVSITSPSPDLISLSCVIGDCPMEEREAFFAELLLANLLGQGTRGAILGMNSEGNLLTLTKDIDYPIDYKNFRDIVEDFFNAADVWRQEILNRSTKT